MEFVRVANAPSNQKAVDGHRQHKSYGQSNCQAPPEQPGVNPRIYGAGDQPFNSIVNNFHRCYRDGISSQGDFGEAFGIQTLLSGVSKSQQVAKKESQHNRQASLSNVGPILPNGHTQNLTNATAG